MRQFTLIAAFFALLATAPGASANVASAAPDSFLIQGEANLAASPAVAWAALTHPQRWWSGAHTYSGDASRLRLDPRAGGCWCERWGTGQSVEHARVVLAMQRDGVRTLRLVGGLGPLQELGATGVFTFTISPRENGSRIAMTYRVGGAPGVDLSQLAPVVDQVLMEQLNRLARFADTGAPA